MQEPPAYYVQLSQEVGRAGVQWEGRRWRQLKGGLGGTWMDGVQRLSWRNTPENHEHRGGITAENETPFQV